MNIVVSGAYQTNFGELWNYSLEDLIFESINGALKDASRGKKEIDVVFFGNMLSSSLSSQNHISALINQFLKSNVPVIRVESACASGGVAIAQACTALESGQYEKALVIGAEKMTDFPVEQISYALMNAASEQERDAGLSFVGLYALMANQYIETFGATEQDLALPAIKNHKHAATNKKAQFPFEISLQQVMESPLVADPLRLLHCSPISDGAAAVVLEKNNKKKNNTTKIVASAQAGETLALSERDNFFTLQATEKAAKKAYTQAGLGPKDVSLLEVHDCFTIAELLAIEDLGLYKKGEGFVAMRNGDLQMGGKYPVNSSGGLKACGHPVGATGVKQMVEVVHQLRTKKPLVGLTHNIGGTGGTAVIHILQR